MNAKPFARASDLLLVRAVDQNAKNRRPEDEPRRSGTHEANLAQTLGRPWEGGIMSIRGYFALSQPATFGARRPASTASGAQTPAPTSIPSRQLTLAWQIAIYFILLGAIVASRFLDLYRAGVPFAFQLDWAYLSFIAICSL